jgi:hypothetical protein
MPDLIQIIPKTRYEFDGRIGSSQSITLKERIPAVAFGSGVLVVRVHEIDGWATSASATVGVRAQSVAPEDPGLEFVDTVNLLSSVDINDDDVVPELLIGKVGEFPASFDVNAPMLQVLMLFSQGATAASGNQSLTLGVDLVLREVK